MPGRLRTLRLLTSLVLMIGALVGHAVRPEGHRAEEQAPRPTPIALRAANRTTFSGVNSPPS